MLRAVLLNGDPVSPDGEHADADNNPMDKSYDELESCTAVRGSISATDTHTPPTVKPTTKVKITCVQTVEQLHAMCVIASFIFLVCAHMDISRMMATEQ